MEPVNLFALAAQQSRWLAVRQSAIAGNVANVNTPGYAAADVEPFQKLLDRGPVTLQATHAGHISGPSGAEITVKRDDPRAVAMPSGNTVELEQELMKAGEVRRAFEINTAVVKSFHRMIMMTVRS